MTIPLFLLAAYMTADFCTKVAKDIGRFELSIAWVAFNALFTVAAVVTLLVAAGQLA